MKGDKQKQLLTRIGMALHKEKYAKLLLEEARDELDACRRELEMEEDRDAGIKT